LILTHLLLIMDFYTVFLFYRTQKVNATLFDLLCFFVHDTAIRNTLLLRKCYRLEATGSRVEAGLQGERCRCMLVLRSKSVEEIPSVPTGTRTYAPHIRGSNGPVY
jgi:hypothetical protein